MNYKGVIIRESLQDSAILKILLFNEDYFYRSTHKIDGIKLKEIILFISKKDKKISIYLQIEDELITLFKEKHKRENLVSEDYYYALVEPAIKRVAGNNLSHVKNDRWFDKRLPELKRKYNRWYYEIACKYKLPTMRIVPFLIRLST